MKKLIALVLVIALIGFLALTKPTTDEFARWYAEQTLTEDTWMSDLMQNFVMHMAAKADCQDYVVCRIFEYNGEKVLGVALTFWPLDDLTQQAENLRSEYAQWLEQAGVN